MIKKTLNYCKSAIIRHNIVNENQHYYKQNLTSLPLTQSHLSFQLADQQQRYLERRPEPDQRMKYQKQRQNKRCTIRISVSLSSYLPLTLFSHVIYDGSRSNSFSSARGPLNQANRLLKNTFNSKNLSNKRSTGQCDAKTSYLANFI